MLPHAAFSLLMLIIPPVSAASRLLFSLTGNGSKHERRSHQGQSYEQHMHDSVYESSSERTGGCLLFQVPAANAENGLNPLRGIPPGEIFILFFIFI